MLKFVAAASLAIVLAASGCGSETTGARWAFAQDSEVSPRALKNAAKDEWSRAFYEAREWKAAWSGGNEDDLLDVIGKADRHGIDAARFVKSVEDAEGGAAKEAALTQAALNYASALAFGQVDPDKIHEIYDLPRNKNDLPAGLAAALDGGNIEAWFETLAPQDEEYKALSAAYMDLKGRLGKATETNIPVGPMIRPGSRDARIPALAARLAEIGLVTLPEGAAPAAYAPQLVTAVKQLQAANGLKDDGVIGPSTLELLNTGLGDRALQLALNLERRRWLARDPAPTRIDVNTAAAFLRLYKDGTVVDSRRTVVGSPKDATPQIGHPFEQLVVNPPWNVPTRIAEEEILPKGPDYLARNNMFIEAGGRVVQKPGPDAALGAVKFDMQNRYAIYLHDTPAKALFANEQRHLSHGCVRVDGAVDFARMLARQTGKLAEFEQALASGQTTTVPLGTEIPVRLLYHTAFIGENGQVAFRPDVYGWDEALAKAMGLQPGKRKFTAADIAVSIGP